MHQHDNSTWCWLSDPIIGNTFNATCLVIVLHFNCQSTIAVVSICCRPAILEPWNYWVWNSSRFTCNLKNCTECDVHISRWISYDLGRNYKMQLREINSIKLCATAYGDDINHVLCSFITLNFDCMFLLRNLISHRDFTNVVSSII